MDVRHANQNAVRMTGGALLEGEARLSPDMDVRHANQNAVRMTGGALRSGRRYRYSGYPAIGKLIPTGCGAAAGAGAWSTGSSIGESAMIPRAAWRIA